MGEEVEVEGAGRRAGIERAVPLGVALRRSMRKYEKLRRRCEYRERNAQGCARAGRPGAMCCFIQATAGSGANVLLHSSYC
jgi:hypothetical protein